MKSRNNIQAIVLAIAGLSLFGCGGSDTKPGGTARTADGRGADEKLTLAVIPKSTGGEFWETVEQGAREAGKDLDVIIKWEGPLSETEMAEQNKIIENMVNLGIDGMA